MSEPRPFLEKLIDEIILSEGFAIGIILHRIPTVSIVALILDSVECFLRSIAIIEIFRRKFCVTRRV